MKNRIYVSILIGFFSIQASIQGAAAIRQNPDVIDAKILIEKCRRLGITAEDLSSYQATILQVAEFGPTIDTSEEQRREIIDRICKLNRDEASTIRKHPEQKHRHIELYFGLKRAVIRAQYPNIYIAAMQPAGHQN